MEEMMSKYTLKTARELNGLKQKDAAKLLGISVDTLRNYERGKSYPDIPILKKIEELYKLPYYIDLYFKSIIAHEKANQSVRGNTLGSKIKKPAAVREYG